MEVLISVFILSIGLLGVGALIPVGKLAMKETDKSDRTGACGRAALRQIKVQKLLDVTVWPQQPTPTTNVFVIDPLGALAFGSNTLGGLSRVNLAPGGVALTQAQADPIFRSQDDLIFSRPEEIKSGTIPPAGTRPVVPPPLTAAPSEGNASWFLTVGPDSLQSTLFNVSVVVCYKRDLLSSNSEDTATGVTASGCGPGCGGAVIQVAGKQWPANWSLKNDNWILLIDPNGAGGAITQATWYRVVGAGFDGKNTNITLVGPDWLGALSGLTAVSVNGVTGVYSETVQLN